jgi:predicted alpha/beta-hydrolase family hydrolase
VIFAHPSGSSRHSPRHCRIAGALQRAGFGTVLLDLLTADEARAAAPDGAIPMDLELLADRLQGATAWVEGELGGRRCPIGYIAVDIGAAAALIAAAREATLVQSIVAVSGRPDLAGTALPGVAAPTLLIVGAQNAALFELNRQAHDFLTTQKSLTAIPGVRHPDEDPRALEHVAAIAIEWLREHMRTEEKLDG